VDPPAARERRAGCGRIPLGARAAARARAPDPAGREQRQPDRARAAPDRQDFPPAQHVAAGLRDSGGKATPANLFVNLATRNVGIIGSRKVVVFDEIASTSFADAEATISMLNGLHGERGSSAAARRPSARTRAS
jgi:hypothetical protein